MPRLNVVNGQVHLSVRLVLLLVVRCEVLSRIDIRQVLGLVLVVQEGSH